VSPSLRGRAIAAYTLPTVGVSFSLVFTIAYVSKFSTDVLLMAPATIGAILGASRIWDAITDPLIGNLSDRTHTRFGRRRPWLLLSSLPIAGFGLMVWSPPPSLSGGALTAWMVVGIFGLFTGMTAFIVPHYALGAELVRSYHERTRVFGLRQVGWTFGMVAALVLAVGAMERSDAPRDLASTMFLGIGALCVISIALSVAGVREQVGHAGRGGDNPYKSFRDVWANPHGRRLLVMLFIEHTGAGAGMVLSPYLLEYVIGRPEAISIVFGFYTASMMLSIPMWVAVSKRLDKKRAWLVAMGVAMTGYTLLLFVGEGDVWLMCLVTTLTGSASSAGRVIGTSIQADVIDWDEHATGERKEGSYYSAFTFLEKTSSGIMAMLTGLALSAVGFEPNVEQTEETKWVIRSLMGSVPLASFAIGALIFSRFRLTETEHAEIRAELDRRATESG
jgi:GPH family glycoside/pentoside/hexuronide:cation symporter